MAANSSADGGPGDEAFLAFVSGHSLGQHQAAETFLSALALPGSAPSAIHAFSVRPPAVHSSTTAAPPNAAPVNDAATASPLGTIVTPSATLSLLPGAGAASPFDPLGGVSCTPAPSSSSVAAIMAGFPMPPPVDLLDMLLEPVVTTPAPAFARPPAVTSGFCSGHAAAPETPAARPSPASASQQHRLVASLVHAWSMLDGTTLGMPLGLGAAALAPGVDCPPAVYHVFLPRHDAASGASLSRLPPAAVPRQDASGSSHS